MSWWWTSPAAVLLTLGGAGAVSLNGGSIIATQIGETLENNGNTISGFGKIGDGTSNLTLNNNAGTIDANNSSNALILNTGSNIITNAATLEATGGATLDINSAVEQFDRWRDRCRQHRRQRRHGQFRRGHGQQRFQHRCGKRRRDRFRRKHGHQPECAVRRPARGSPSDGSDLRRRHQHRYVRASAVSPMPVSPTPRRARSASKAPLSTMLAAHSKPACPAI